MDKRKDLVKYCHLVADNNLVLGSSGNISIRKEKVMLIKSSGCFMNEARTKDFLYVDIKTLKYKHKLLRPSCELKMHALSYQVRSDVNAVLHSHPVYATTLVSCSVKPELISPEFILSIGSGIGIVEYICPGTMRLARSVSESIKKHNLVYLKNHGLLAVGKNLKEAFTRTILAEQMAKMQIIALAMGKKLNKIKQGEVKKLLTAFSQKT